MFDTTLHQMILFFLVLCIGFIAAKAGVIKRETLPSFSKIVVSVLLPALILYSTYTGVAREAVLGNLSMLLLAAGFYLLMIAVTYVLARLLGLRGDRGRVFQLCFIFGNTGFVGTPLLAAVFPQNGMLYMMLFTLVDQLLFWTYGVYLSTAQGESDHEDGFPAGHSHGPHRHPHRLSWRMFVSPNTVAMAVAFAAVLAAVPVPQIITDCVGSVAAATPAMCMIYLGALLCYSDWRGALKTRDLYVGIAVKMVLLPIVLGRLLIWCGAFPLEMVECFTIIAALPVMTLVPIIASKNGHEGDYAAGITVATLVVSVITIPFVAWAAF